MTDLATGKPRQVTTGPMLATMVNTFGFTKDGRQLAVVLVPDARPPAPLEPAAPAGPRITINEDKDRNRLRTFPSLMSTPYEFDLLEWHATGQLALIDVQALAVKDPKSRAGREAIAKAVRKVGQPAMIRSMDLSPDGKYIRVTRMTRPFSYIVPVEQLRHDRGDLGRHREGSGEGDRPSAQPGRPGSEPATAGSDDAGRRRGGAGAAGQARAGVACRRTGADLPRTGAGASG